ERGGLAVADGVDGAHEARSPYRRKAGGVVPARGRVLPGRFRRYRGKSLVSCDKKNRSQVATNGQHRRHQLSMAGHAWPRSYGGHIDARMSPEVPLPDLVPLLDRD